MIAPFAMVMAVCAASGGLRLELGPLNGTNELLRGEIPYAIATYEAVGSPVTAFSSQSRERFQIRPAGGAWSDCPEYEDATKDAPVVRSWGRRLEVGVPQQIYLGRVDRLCPGMTSRVGAFEIRLSYVEQGVELASATQLFSVREPRGSDAEAARLLEKSGSSLDQRSFVRRFPSSPYAAPYLGARRPGADVPDFRKWTAELQRSGSATERAEEANLLQQFVDRNPKHLFAEGVRTHLVAISAAEGDMSRLRANVGELERSGSKSAAEARAFLTSLENSGR